MRAVIATSCLVIVAGNSADEHKYLWCRNIAVLSREQQCAKERCFRVLSVTCDFTFFLLVLFLPLWFWSLNPRAGTPNRLTQITDLLNTALCSRQPGN